MAMILKFKQKILLDSPRGQTLIEAVVTLGIALIIITSVVALVNASTRRATLARQSTQASKLAQQGMEIVRHIRDVDSNLAVQVSFPCSTASPCSWNELYRPVAIGLVEAYLVEGLPSCAVHNSWCLIGTQPAEEADLLSNSFSREIEISDTNLSSGVICADPGPAGTPSGVQDIKRVTVVVGWESPIGHQERTVVSCLRQR